MAAARALQRARPDDRADLDAALGGVDAHQAGQPLGTQRRRARSRTSRRPPRTTAASQPRRQLGAGPRASGSGAVGPQRRVLGAAQRVVEVGRMVRGDRLQPDVAAGRGTRGVGAGRGCQPCTGSPIGWPCSLTRVIASRLQHLANGGQPAAYLVEAGRERREADPQPVRVAVVGQHVVLATAAPSPRACAGWLSVTWPPRRSGSTGEATVDAQRRQPRVGQLQGVRRQRDRLRADRRHPRLCRSGRACPASRASR